MGPVFNSSQHQFLSTKTGKTARSRESGEQLGLRLKSTGSDTCARLCDNLRAMLRSTWRPRVLGLVPLPWKSWGTQPQAHFSEWGSKRWDKDHRELAYFLPRLSPAGSSETCPHRGRPAKSSPCLGQILMTVSPGQSPGTQLSPCSLLKSPPGKLKGLRAQDCIPSMPQEGGSG